jgi:D-xylose transport system substrate-binding protein
VKPGTWRVNATVLALGVALLAVAAAGCGGSSKPSSITNASGGGGGGGGKIQVCALLPDDVVHALHALRRAVPERGLQKATVEAQVLNALGDSQKQKSQAQQCLAKGTKVILLDRLNAASGTAITNLAVGQARR